MCGRGEAVVRGGETRVERRWQDAMGGVRVPRWFQLPWPRRWVGGGWLVGRPACKRPDGWR